MRIKVECGPPLPSLKVWFVVPASAATISELKSSLYSELPALRCVPLDDLTLSLDGFEMTDSSAIDVIRDSELITVKRTPSSSNKRKAADEALSSSLPPKRAKYTTQPPTPISKAQASQETSAASQHLNKLAREDPILDSASEPSSDSGTSSESSDSDTSSDTSSDESSSSSSAPSAEPSRAPARGQTNPQAQQRNAQNTPVHHAPPGQGKATTQNRNARRRRKKMYQRLTAQAEPASANDISLGERRAIPEEPVPPELHSQQSRSTTLSAPTFMMASLSNKNKRKGFKQAMAGLLPQKIVFPAEEMSTERAEEAPLPFVDVPTAEVAAVALNTRLIPPSEKQEKGQIPANIFVTSIDVEGDMHTGRKKNKKKAAEKKLVETDMSYETAEVGNVVLDYGEPDVHLPTQRDQPTSEAPSYPEGDWKHVEKNWADLGKLTEHEQLQPGALVGWKALGINPATFTPEFMLNVGRVVRVGGCLTIQPVHKPGAVEVSFGGYADEADVVPPEEETFEWNEVYTGDWKIV